MLQIESTARAIRRQRTDAAITREIAHLKRAHQNLQLEHENRRDVAMRTGQTGDQWPRLREIERAQSDLQLRIVSLEQARP